MGDTIKNFKIREIIVVTILILFLTMGIVTATNNTDVNFISTNQIESNTDNNFNGDNIDVNNNIETKENYYTTNNKELVTTKSNVNNEVEFNNSIKTQQNIKSENNTQQSITYGTVDKINTTVRNNLTFISTFVDKNNDYLSSGKVAFKINGKTIGYANITNGKAALMYNISSLSAKTYNITAVYGGNITQEPFTATNLLILTKNSSHSSIDQVVASVTNRVSFKATIVDSNYKYITSGKVAFKINGKTIGYANIINGKAILSYDTTYLSAKTYKITVVYGGSNNCYATTASNNMKLSTINPFESSIPLLSDGTPNINAMVNVKWANENGTYTLTRAQYDEVIQRDSYCLYLNNALSKYTFFQIKGDTKTYYIIAREKWNVIEKAINTYKVLQNTMTGPSEITVNLAGKSYTYAEVRDQQNTGYTCGPTSVSACTQVLRNYVNEALLAKLAGSTATAGSSSRGLKKAVESCNMSATIYYKSSFNTALNELAKGGCALVFHTWSHYVAILDISADKTKVLVCNPSGTYNEGSHGIPTKWLSVSYMKTCFNNYDTSGLIIKLNYALTNTQKTRYNQWFKNMGGAFIDGDTTERITQIGR